MPESNNSSSLPPQPINAAPPSQPKKSRLNFLSSLSAVTVMLPSLFICTMCLLLYAVVKTPAFREEQLGSEGFTKLGLGIYALVFAAGVGSILGLVVGIAALFRKNSNKVLGVIGIIVNFLILMGFCGVLFFISLVGSI